jgi:predicted RNA-binding Zn-ribbon protein involved in translation (DUF1610 family)
LERKYSHRGYMDTDAPKKKEKRPPQNHGRQEQIGPRTPRMVGTITRARCSNCGAVLQAGFDANAKCPRCGFDLHSCKQCMYFDTSAQFECTQPIGERFPKKDVRNDCTFYAFRTTVEKDTAPNTAAPASAPPTNGNSSRPNDARKAFDDLFKK